MSMRVKLMLGFLTLSLVAMVIFSIVAYTSARNYTRDVALEQLHKGNVHLVNMLDSKTPSIKMLQSMIPHHETDDNTLSIIDTSNNTLKTSKHFIFAQHLLSEFAKQNNSEKSAQGNFVIGDKEYLWAIDRILNTPYAIANIHQKDNNDLSKFFAYLGPPLSITLIFSIWISVWAGAILANLFNQLSEKNKQLEYQAKHDLLTNLPNRSAIGNLVQQTLDDTKPTHGKLLFCLIDIDALKEINDSLGHESGDILLNQVTRRLKHTLRDSDRIGRFGGNKFAALLNVSNTESIDRVCQKLLENFEPIYEINGHNIFVHATLGISVYPDHATGAQELIQKTETALHKAKKLAVDYVIYDLSQDINSTERLRLTHDLRNAINNEELQLHYQPKLDARNNAISSVEALARWIHPQHGFIPPDVFIEIAEKTGLIQPLTDWVLRTAIKQCAEWHNLGKSITVSINLSARNLHDETLGNQISNLLNYWNISADKLCLEITETTMMTDPEHARKILNNLDKLGVRLSIDDFGTGYSSLSYLKQLPVDELKVDKSFVLNMAKDENDASIVRATISLAHDLGLEVVAEGVEDQESQNELTKIGCDYIQGYHIARPMPQDELTKMLITKDSSSNEKVIKLNSVKKTT